MDETELRRHDRFRILEAIYQESHGSTTRLILSERLVTRLGLDDTAMANAYRYLENEGLIEGVWPIPDLGRPYQLRLTHRGILALEASNAASSESTGPPPPHTSTITVHGDVLGSSIQAAGAGSTQSFTQAAAPDLDLVRAFVLAYHESAASMELPDDQRAEIAAEIATVEAQLSSPRPRVKAISSALHRIRPVLEGTASGVAASGLLELLAHLGF